MITKNLRVTIFTAAVFLITIPYFCQRNAAPVTCTSIEKHIAELDSR